MLRTKHYSRVPVYLQSIHNIKGIVYAQDVLQVPDTEAAKRTLETLMRRDVYFVPETKRASELLNQMQRENRRIAIVIDEYGGVAGLVTVEDLIEEIVGDIRDEHDESTPDVVRAGNGWRVSGLLRIDEVADATGFRGHDGEYETIGGLVMHELGHIPEAGESVELKAFEPDSAADDAVRWRATVAKMEGRRIDQLDLIELPRRDASAVVTDG